ncbi:MAG TPA: hypothetical protein VGK32_07140 [Vicinamibacterales bacterium]|jgi:hypothetical protein
MPSFSGRFAYLVPGQGAVQDGPCQVSFDESTLTLVPGAGPSTAFDLGDIDRFTTADYELRLSLYTGTELRLTHFAKAFQDLERQMLAAYRDRLVQCLLVSDLNEVARFDGQVHLESQSRECGGPAQVRLYESNLAVLPDAAVGLQWRLADVDAVEFNGRDYAVVVTCGDERLTIGRLAKRTGELADRIRNRVTVLNERSARTLRALFPFLTPDQFRRLSTVMREGHSAPIERLRAIHLLTESVLLEKVVDSKLRPYLHALAKRSAGEGWFAGFKIVRRDPRGEESDVTANEDCPPDAEEGSAESAASDVDGHPADAIIDLGDGLEVLYWFFFPIATAGSVRASHLAWEATSSGGRATYAFRLAMDSGGAASPTADRLSASSLEAAVGVINRGLLALNFRREPVYLSDDVLQSEQRYRHYAIAQRKVPELARVRASFAGRAIHTSVPTWARQVDRLVQP